MKKLLKILALTLAAILLLGIYPAYSLLSTSYLTAAPLSKVDPDIYTNAAATLSNPNATQEAKDLMTYLKQIYGKNVLSGQYIDTYQNYDEEKFLGENGKFTILKSNELVALQSVIGDRLPAMIGLDFSGVEYPEEWTNYVTDLAIEWHEMGGIVTFCWHWIIPDTLDISGENSRWNAKMYTKDLPFTLNEILADKESSLYKKLLSDIDAVAAELKTLEAAGVPVLWRPLHEAAGTWFWWGSGGAEGYKELYNLLYTRLTETHELNNLIWVFNAQKSDWYPGDSVVDIVADDPYPVNNMRALYTLDRGRINRFKYHANFAGSKMIMMSESDCLPDIDAMFAKNAVWLSFCTWMRNMVCQGDGTEYGMTNLYSEEYNSKETLQKVYNDQRVLKLSDITPR